MNGGRTGAYHISAPWGDSALASMFGSNAVADGGEMANEVFASMQESPESFTGFSCVDACKQAGTGIVNPGCVLDCVSQGGTSVVPKARGDSACLGECESLGVGRKQLCQIQCQVQELGQVIAIMAIGVGLVVVGALALTK